MPLNLTVERDEYFCLDNILASQEKLPCTVQIPIHRLGYLDQCSEGDTLQPGTKLELPLWLANALCKKHRIIVSVNIPRAYRESYQQILKADPNVVDLFKLGPYFYIFGSCLLVFEHPSSLEIAKCLVKVN